MNRHEALLSLIKQIDAENKDSDGRILQLRIDNRVDAADRDTQLGRQFDAFNHWASNLVLDGHRLDAGESALLARELLYVQAKQVSQQYAEMKSSRFIPMSSAVPAGTDSFSTEIYGDVGSAKLITNYATDFPAADVFKSEHIQKVFGFGNSFSWSVQDLRRSALTKGQPLDQRRAATARNVHDRLIDGIAANGDSATGLLGLTSHGSVSGVNLLTAGSEIVGDWATATADEMFSDLNIIESTAFLASYGLYQPDTLLLDPEAYNIGYNTAANDFSTESVLSVWLRSRAQFVRNIDQWHMLSTAGATSATRAVCYPRNSDVLEMLLPLSFMMHSPQQEMLAFKVPCESRFAGTLLYRPQAMTYADGL